MPTLAAASGYGVFTQGASGLGQANAVVAHTTGPSSIYFNPALINDVPGRQIEVGTTAVYSDREIDYTGGGSENGDSAWNFPSTFYYTHQANDKLTSGLGIFFPFGLSNEWDDNYEGRYIGTSGEMLTMNINPAVSYRVTDRLSLAVGLDFVYLDTEIKANVNQTVAGGLLPPILGGPLAELLPDVRQKFSGDGWGAGYNLGILFKATDRVSIGAAYRSKVKIDVEGDMSLYGVDPRMQLLFQEGNAESDIQLPAQFTVGVATQVTDALLIEVGARWEDWDVNDTQTLELQNPILGETRIVQNRNWHSTWSYNIGANYKLNDNLALNCGYLYGENAVPNETFEPIIPDSDAHLFTIGTDLKKDAWTLSAAFGYEYHEERTKNNAVGDPVGSLAAGFPVGTANGDYNTDIYLFALSLGYAF
ncbi:MAG: outer membrane protein transport protein [Deltaproteobacteria bacterium]|nr:outer membrane protein transport protein [Deltaproteobacteria bacterium]